MKSILAILVFVLASWQAMGAEPLRVVVYKEARRLELRQGETVVKSYKVGLGFAPVGKKVKQGDGKTPEGVYSICVKNPQSRFYLSLGINYPSPADAKAGLDAKLITAADYARIVAAHKKGGTPPWDTKLGGEIFIHGNGSASDWTWGCVALDDAEIKDLYQRVEIGTAVEIRK